MCPEASFLTSLSLDSPSEPGGESSFVRILEDKALELTLCLVPGARGLSMVACLLGGGDWGERLEPAVEVGLGGKAAGTPAPGPACLSFRWLFSKVL